MRIWRPACGGTAAFSGVEKVRVEKAQGLRAGRAGQRSAGARDTQLSQELNSWHKGGQRAGSGMATVSGAQPERVVEAGLPLPPFLSPLSGPLPV